MKPLHPGRLAASLVLVVTLTASHAADIVKTNDASALNLGTSWVGGAAPGTSDIAVFNATMSSGTALNPAIGGEITWNGIKVLSPTAAVGIYNTGIGINGSVLTLGAGGIDLSAATQNLTIRARVGLSINQDWNVASGRTLAIDGWGTVSSGGPVMLDFAGYTATKKGAGTLNILNGYGVSNGSLVIDGGVVQMNNSGGRNIGAAGNFTFRVNSGSLGINNNLTSASGVDWNAKVQLAGGKINLSYSNGGAPLVIGGIIEAVSATSSQIDYPSTNSSSTPLSVEIPAKLTGSGTIVFRATTVTANRLQDRVTLTGDNSGFTGTLDVNSTTASSNRTLRLGAADAGSAAGSWNIGASNNLEVHGVNVSLGSLTGTGTLRNSSSSAATVTVGGGGANSSFGGVIAAGSGALNLVKDGAGTFTLSGTHAYTGNTTVSNGKLVVNGSIASSGLTSVNAGAVLGGSGTLGTTTVAGTHSPGNSPGVQTVTGNLTYSAGSHVVWELIANSTTGRGTGFDGIDVTGNLAFTGATTLDLEFALAGSTVDWSDALWDNSITGTNGWKVFDLTTGTITGLGNLAIGTGTRPDASGDTLAAVRPNASFSLFQDGNDIYLNYTNVSPIPEPGSLLGLGLLLGVPLLSRRRH